MSIVPAMEIMCKEAKEGQEEIITKLEEIWKQEELLAEKHTRLRPCVERGLKVREDFEMMDVKDEDMIFAISEEENDLIKEIYSNVLNNTVTMFLGMKVIVGRN